MLITLLLVRTAFKVFTIIVAAAIVVAIWWFDAAALVAAFDANLRIVKWGAVQMSPSLGSKAEALFRLLGADRMLFFGEVVAGVELVLLAIGRMFRFMAHAAHERHEHHKKEGGKKND